MLMHLSSPFVVFATKIVRRHFGLDRAKEDARIVPFRPKTSIWAQLYKATRPNHRVGLVHFRQKKPLCYAQTKPGALK